jgi:hypothetical protein
MDNVRDSGCSAHGGVGSRGSEPARLCCALTRLSRALAVSVPRNEMRMVLARGFCESRGFLNKESEWRSEDGAS